jgi:hypothetical protein
MKNIFFFVMALVISTSAFAAEKYSCMLNRTMSMEVIVRDDGDVILQRRLWNSVNAQSEVILSRPEVIRYGGVLIILENRGRSGYSLIRITHNEPGRQRIEAQIDINRFGEASATALNTNGNFSMVSCQKL